MAAPLVTPHSVSVASERSEWPESRGRSGRGLSVVDLAAAPARQSRLGGSGASAALQLQQSRRAIIISRSEEKPPRSSPAGGDHVAADVGDSERSAGLVEQSTAIGAAGTSWVPRGCRPWRRSTRSGVDVARRRDRARGRATLIAQRRSITSPTTMIVVSSITVGLRSSRTQFVRRRTAARPDGAGVAVDVPDHGSSA